MATGSCQCGSVRYIVGGEPLMVYACHCKDCQKRTGSAFSMGAIFPANALEITGELTSWSRTSERGNTNTRFSCARCGNVMYGSSDSSPDLIKLQPGTLDDSSNVQPEAHIWMREAQPWIQLPQSVVRHDTQPDNLFEIYEAVLKQREAS